MSDQPPASSTNSVHSTTEQDPDRYDWSVTPPSIAVLETIADFTGQSPTSLPPLYEVVDPDSLDTICGRGTIVKGAGLVRISFRYAGHEVTISSDGDINVAPKPSAT